MNGRLDVRGRRKYRGSAEGEQDDEDDSASVGSCAQVVLRKGSYNEGIGQIKLRNV